MRKLFFEHYLNDKYIQEVCDTEKGSLKVSGLYNDNDIMCCQFNKDGFVSVIMMTDSNKKISYLKSTLKILGASGLDGLYRCEKLSLEIKVGVRGVILISTKSDSARTVESII